MQVCNRSGGSNTPSSRGTESSLTLRWREPDSKHQFRDGVVARLRKFFRCRLFRLSGAEVRWRSVGRIGSFEDGEALSWLRKEARGLAFAKTEFAADLYGSFSVKWFFVVAGSLFGAERPFLVPSPAIRFAERAERCQGTEMLAKLGGLPLSVACVFAATPVQARGRL